MSEQSEIISYLESFEHTGIYIIDRDTMEVYFENKTAKKYTVKDRIGEPCYRVHGNRSMCATCPLRNKNRITYVNREDHGMIFSVKAIDTMWNGISAYTIIVEKEKDIPERKSLSEASMERLNRALHSSIISYVDVNMGTQMCQAIHFKEDGNHNIYNMPYDEYMRKICFSEYVYQEDHIHGEQVLGIENLRKLSENSEGPNETSIRFRVSGDNGENHVLESTAYILRDELPHHISIVAKEVTQEEKNRAQLSLYNKLVSNAVTTYQLNLTQNTFQNVVGYELMTPKVRGELETLKTIDEFYQFVLRYTVGEEEKRKAKLFLNRDRQLTMFEENQSILRERLPIDMDDGSYMWLDITCNMLRNPLTEDVEAILYSEAVDQDVISENTINQMIMNDYDYIVVFDLMNHTNYVFANNERYDKAEMESNLSQENREDYFRKCYAGDHLEEFLYHNTAAYIREQLEQSDKYENYYYMREKDGSVAYKKETISYLNGDKRYFLMSRTDHTDAIRSQEELNARLSCALEEARKATEERTELFARMSHDLRTPMNGILGMTALSKTESDVSVLHNNMMRIDASGKYMLRMINDTLDMKRIESGNLILNPKPDKCSYFIENLHEMIRPSAEEKNLSFEIVNKNIDLNRYAFFDAIRMKQIFTNLVLNAVKFTPEGGKIQFTMECLKHEKNVDYDVFEIVDTGIGMSKEFMEHKLFQPYAQEDNQLTGKYVGPGLGLAITKSLVDLMDGRIEVESELGEGTRFRIYLKIQMMEEEEALKILNSKKNVLAKAEEVLNHKHILLCEDHPLNAEISIKLLEQVGCKVSWAKDGEEGVQFFRTSSLHNYDAILMDIMMPNVDGIEATKMIRHLDRADAQLIPIIAMTANAFEEDRKATKEAGMNCHLAKPVVPALLYETLQEYVK